MTTIQRRTSPLLHTSIAPETNEPATPETAPSTGGERIDCMGPGDRFERVPAGPFERGPTSSVTVGDQTYKIDHGRVRLNGNDIGTMDDSGNYAVTIDGVQQTGNVADLIGAVIEGALSKGEQVADAPSDLPPELTGLTELLKDGAIRLGSSDNAAMASAEVSIDGRQYEAVDPRKPRVGELIEP